MVEGETEETVDHQACKTLKASKAYHRLKDTVASITVCDMSLVNECKSACLVQILMRLTEVVCRHRPELWPTVGYMKLCVDTDLNCGRQLVT
jgi:hypothetical protein